MLSQGKRAAENNNPKPRRGKGQLLSEQGNSQPYPSLGFTNSDPQSEEVALRYLAQWIVRYILEQHNYDNKPKPAEESGDLRPGLDQGTG